MHLKGKKDYMIKNIPQEAAGHHRTDLHKFQLRHRFGSFPSVGVASRRPGLRGKLQDHGG